MEEAKRLPKARARRGRLRPHPCALGRVSCTARRPLGWGGRGRAGRPSYLAIPARAPAHPQSRAVTRALLPRCVPTRRKSMVRGAGERAPPRENLGGAAGAPGGRAPVPLPSPLLRFETVAPHTLAHTHTPRTFLPLAQLQPGLHCAPGRARARWAPRRLRLCSSDAAAAARGLGAARLLRSSRRLRCARRRS